MQNKLTIPAGTLEIELALPPDMNTVIGILQDAAYWLLSKQLPTWQPNAFEPVVIPAIARGEAYLAKLDGQPVATFILQWSDKPFWGDRPDEAGYIHKLAVVRAAAGKSIGNYILKWAEAKIAATGRKYLRLDCKQDNPTINQYYQQAGFNLCGVTTVGNFKANLYEKVVIKTLV